MRNGEAPATPPLAPEGVVSLGDDAGVLVRWYCTPAKLEELAVGWLVGEGRITGAGDLGALRVDRAAGQLWLESGSAKIRAGGDAPLPESSAVRASELVAGIAEDPSVLRDLFSSMFDRAELRERSGGVHTGALVVREDIVWVREDVSRHCVVDKLVGRATLDGLPLDRALLLLSGRISGAIAAKGARTGLAAMATMSIPTTLAAEIAGKAGMTLFGRARSAEPHVYRPAAADSGT